MNWHAIIQKMLATMRRLWYGFQLAKDSPCWGLSFGQSISCMYIYTSVYSHRILYIVYLPGIEVYIIIYIYILRQSIYVYNKKQTTSRFQITTPILFLSSQFF